MSKQCYWSSGARRKDWSVNSLCCWRCLVINTPDETPSKSHPSFIGSPLLLIRSLSPYHVPQWFLVIVCRWLKSSVWTLGVLFLPLFLFCLLLRCSLLLFALYLIGYFLSPLDSFLVHSLFSVCFPLCCSLFFLSFSHHVLSFSIAIYFHYAVSPVFHSFSPITSLLVSSLSSPILSFYHSFAALRTSPHRAHKNMQAAISAI